MESASVAYIWLPVVLAVAAYRQFYSWRQLWFREKKMERVLLEIVLPKEIYKSPAAMEMVIASMWYTTPGLPWNVWYEGSVRNWSSLEICSFGGEIHFYIWTNAKWQNSVEANIYANYPEVEVFEAEDYTAKISYGLPGSPWKLWGGTYGLKAPDPYPLKTYIDYGLDKDPKEEYKIDPITPVLEFLSQLTPDEQVWLQIPIMAAKADDGPPYVESKDKSWKAQAEAEISRLMRRDLKAPPERDLSMQDLMTSPGERSTVEAIERSLDKKGFYTGFRVLYMFRMEKPIVPRFLALLGIYRSFDSQSSNNIGFKESTTYDQPWEDVTGLRAQGMRQMYWEEYRKRMWFYPPFRRKAHVLTTEELATIFHFPGTVSASPGLRRMGSKKGDAPTNLPI